MPDQPGPASPSGVATVEWPPLGEGEVIGEQFRIVKLLGQGGMGQIFEAEDLVLQRRVAVKVPLSRGASDVLMSEARALAALSHPNLPVVHAAGRHGERGYLVMERLVGIDLGTHIERVYELGHAIRLGEALELLIDIADALHAIHQAGIVHRDVKPDNVLLCGRRGPVLIDFGLVVPELNLSGKADVVYAGSPLYMAPEMIHQDAARGAGYLSDLYSFGVVAFELLTGSVPYNAGDLQSLLRLHVEAPIPDVRMLRPDLPADLAALIRELMAKRPGERPQTAEDALWRLRAIAERAKDKKRPKVPTVLVASADDELLGLIDGLLRQWLPRVEIRRCRSGRAALKLLASAAPQMLLLDMQLEDMSGMELLMQLRGEDGAQPDAVVALSSEARPQDLELLRYLDVMSFVSKGPHLPQGLRPLVNNVLAARAEPMTAR